MDGPEIEYFQRAIETHGTPALDVGCGTGRLLVPLLTAGLDVDGCDAAADMIDECRTKIEAQGLNTRLFTAPTHELALEREYQTIISCGVFGIGGARRDDLEGLRRLRSHLAPGGKLIFDLYLPGENAKAWQTWAKGQEPAFPTRWSNPDRRRAADGTDLVLQGRTIDFDPLEQVSTRELRVEHYDGDTLLARSQHRLATNIYLKSEVVLMLEFAGFSDVRVLAGLEEAEPRAYQDYYLMFVAS